MRGERDHRKMVAIPTIKDEDAKRPNRERESLVREQDQIINRMKATLILLGIRGFNPKLKKAAERLEDLRTAEGEPKARDGTPTISTASSPDHRVNPDSYAVGARSRPSTLY